MSKVIAIATSKGGAGKTTLSVNLAVKFWSSKTDVLLVDCDPSKNSTKWSALRELKEHPYIPIMEKTGNELAKAIEKIRDKFSVTILDVPGRMSVETRSAAVVANLMVIPVRPCHFDTWSTDDDIPMLADAAILNPNMKILVVMNGLNPNQNTRNRQIERVRKYMKDHLSRTDINIRIAETFICNRSAFDSAVSEGLGVSELVGKDASTDNAKFEIEKLFKEIKEYLNE